MFHSSQRNTKILLFIAALIAVSIACDAREMVADSDIEVSTVNRPDTTTNEDSNGEEEPELQAYLGTSQIEQISVEPPDGNEDCPPEDLNLSPGGVVNHETNGDKLISTDDTGSKEYSYDKFMDAFCREVPTKMIIDQEIVDTQITECASFHTINGVKEYHLKRYYFRSDVNVLCFDQHNTIKKTNENLSERGTESTLVEQCLASPDMYKVEFTNVNHDHSNKSKEVCQGDFIIQNLSSETLCFRIQKISDSGAMRTEGWTYLHNCIEPGERIEDYFGTQKWTDGRSTLDTFTKIIFVHNSMECTNLITDDNLSTWGEHVVPLDDPCR